MVNMFLYISIRISGDDYHLYVYYLDNYEKIIETELSAHTVYPGVQCCSGGRAGRSGEGS